MDAKLLRLLFILLVLAACKKDERQAIVPAYIYIKEPLFVTSSDNSQGFPSAMINDIWLFDNEIVRGLYKTGSKVPIQRSGKTQIRMTNGVKVDGNSEQRVIYPMYTSFTKEFNLEPGKTDTMQATYTYLSNTIFPFIEDFDGNGSRFEYNPNGREQGDTIIRDKGPDAWLLGNNSGKMVFNSANSSSAIEVYSQVYNNWPRYTPFYLEMDYKGNIPIVVGLYATTTSTGEVSKFPMFITNPTSTWNKLYLNFEPEINKRGPGPGIQYRLYIRCSRGTLPNPEAWIDNIKIVYLD